MDTLIFLLAQPLFLILTVLVELKVFFVSNWLIARDIPAVLSILHIGKEMCFYYLQGYQLMFSLRFFLMWFPNINPYVPPFYIVTAATQPSIKLVRKILPPVMGFDFSYMVCTLLLSYLQSSVQKLPF